MIATDAQILEANALTLRQRNRELSVRRSRELAIELDPRRARALGLTNATAIAAFANSENPAVEFANVSTDGRKAARSDMAAIVRGFRAGGRSCGSSVRLAVQCNPGKAREAGLTSEAEIVQFANAIDAGTELSPSERRDKVIRETTGTTVSGADADTVYALGLPADASAEEVSAAQSAGSKSLTAIWRKMVDWISRTRNVDETAATMFVLGRFPRLALAAQSAGLVKGATVHSSEGKSYSA